MPLYRLKSILILCLFAKASWGQTYMYSPVPWQVYSTPENNNSDPIQQMNERAAQMMGYTSPVIPPSDPAQLHTFILQSKQETMTRQEQRVQEVRSILEEDLLPLSSPYSLPYYQEAMPYYDAMKKLSNMVRKDSFSLADAIFYVEDAWYGNQLSYTAYKDKIQEQINWVKLVLQREKLDVSDNLSLHYAIQKLFSTKICKYNAEGEIVKSHKPFRYDFVDYRGDTSWTKMFVTKLLYNGTGQCHSMPLLYLLIAEEMGAECFLSLAPEHSFVKFRDTWNNWYNFEATNGNIVTEDWLMSSGFVNATSIKNRVFMDTLGKKELAAQAFVDLALGYRQKFGYNQFVWDVVDTLLRLHPNNIQGLMLKADMLLLLTNQELKSAGNPPIENIQNYPAANTYYTSLMASYNQIDDLGYTTLPEELYKAWLLSLEEEKRKQENETIQKQIQENAKKLD